MANFVAYTKRTNNRSTPALYVVGTYAGGGREFVNLAGYDAGSTIPTYAGEDVDGMYGSSAAEFVGGWSPDYSTSSVLPTASFQLVGVQIQYIGFTTASGTLGIQKGDALANYIEKTEHRYLENGHIAIVVYFIDSAIKNIAGGVDTKFIIGANALLQRGNSLIGLTEAGQKRKVPFILSGAYVPESVSSATVQNPSIDLSSFIYGYGDKNFGRHIRVKNIGVGTLNNQAKLWNSVRTQAWSYGGHNHTGVIGAMGNGLEDPGSGDTRFWPTVGSTSAGNGVLGIDNCRDISTAYTSGAIVNYNGDNPATFFATEDFPSINTISDDGYISGAEFDLMELHSHTISDEVSASNDTYSKFTWGKYAGPMSQNPGSRFDPRSNTADAIDVPLTWPSIGAGSTIDTGIKELSHVNPGLPHEVAGEYYGGRSHFYLNGKSRNPYFPDTGSAFSHYVTWYQINASQDAALWHGQGSDFNQEYIPGFIAAYPLATLDDYPGYIADIVRTTVTEYLGGAGSTLDSNSGEAFYLGGVNSVYQRTLDSKFPYTDYIANLLKGSSIPTIPSTNITEINKLTTGANGNIDLWDAKFSAVISPVNGMNILQGKAENTGLPLTTSDDVYGLLQNPTENQLRGDLRGASLFMYTAFVYCDEPQSKEVTESLENPWYELPPASATNNDAVTGGDFRDWKGGKTYTNFSNTLGTIGVSVADWGYEVQGACVDRNSSTFGALLDNIATNGSSDAPLYYNNNSCSSASTSSVPSDYARCGCNYIHEEGITLNELANFNTASSDQLRFEAIITTPRPIQSNLNTTVADPTKTFTSVLYTGSYFSVADGLGFVASSYRPFLNISAGTAVSEMTFRTNAGISNTDTHALVDLGLSNYGTTILPSEFHNLNAADNTFGFTYFPGKEHYEDVAGTGFFVHDDASEARIFATIGGSGSNSTAPSDHKPHRHILLFQAADEGSAGTDAKRAHSDLGFTDCWETTDTEASFISLDVPAQCSTDGKDKPRRRFLPFVNVGRAPDLGLDDTGGGGDPQEDLEGCTTPGALNFNPLANIDNGSCLLCYDSVTYNPGVGTTSGNVNEYLRPNFMIPHILDTRTGTVTGSLLIEGAGFSPFEALDAFIAETLPGNTAPFLNWSDGYIINAFNTKAPNLDDFSDGALNTPSTSPIDYSAAPYNNTANSSLTYFRFENPTTPSLNDFSKAADNALRDIWGQAVTNTLAENALRAAWDVLAQEDAARVTLHFFRIDDWYAYAQNEFVNAAQGNTGWAMDTYGGNLPQYRKANVFGDFVGDFSGIGLDAASGATQISMLTNQYTGPWNFTFRFTNTQAGTLTPTDIGLEAGKHYIAVVKFSPRSCEVGGKAPHYYWAYNFWVKYCACLDENSVNVGYGNPTQAALDAAGLVAPWTLDPFGALPAVNEYFPAAGANQYDGINPGLWPDEGSGAFPGNFCTTSSSSAARLLRGDESTTSQNRLCAEANPDATITCEGFASWCLSDIRPLCNYTETGLPYGTLDMDVLIDGFFTQSQIDPWNLIPVGQGQTIVPGEEFYWRIEVYLQNSPSPIAEVYSHVNDGNGYVQNSAQVTITEAPGELDFVGQLAEINFTGLEWDDGQDLVLEPLAIQVKLVYLGIVNVNTNVVTSAYPDYVVDANGEPVSTCSSYVLTADYELDCTASIQGCTDPLAVNYNEEATNDDGSCEYIDCTQLFNKFENSIYIASIEVTPDTLECVVVEDVNVYQNQNSGTMIIKTRDFASSVLGVSGGVNSDPFYTICVFRMESGSASLLPTALSAYDANSAAIQALQPGTAFPIGAVGDALHGCFIKPDIANASVVYSTEFETDPAGLEGVQHITTVPTASIFNTGDAGLVAGQYLVFIIPDVDLENEAVQLAPCDEVFLTFADEADIVSIGTELGDTECPEPCNQFVDPADCPDAKPGCTDEAAENFNPEATVDDGSCEYCTTCDPCTLYPLDPDCITCDRGQGQDIGFRGIVGFGARLRDCDGEITECCTDPTACNYDENCTNGNKSLCLYNCGNGEEECTGLDAECDDTEPTCPDPSNPACEGDPIGNCIDDGDCNCIGVQCNEDCIFEENGCEPVDPTDDDPVEDIFTTTTAICLPVSGPGADMQVQFQDGSVADNLGEAAAMCSGYNGDKMLMKIKSGVEYDDTDLLKLSLINYLLTQAVTTQLDCMLDCDNYVSGVSTRGKILGHTTRHQGKIDCEAKWKASKKQYFAGSSSFKKGTVVRYIRNVNGFLAASYFIAKRDWRPGMDVPTSIRDKNQRSWEPCVNVKLQESTNPSNYYQTFYEFINRYCHSCTVTIKENRSGSAVDDFQPSRSFLTGFEDENGNEIIF